jgi:hypothetical protein
MSASRRQGARVRIPTKHLAGIHRPEAVHEDPDGRIGMQLTQPVRRARGHQVVLQLIAGGVPAVASNPRTHGQVVESHPVGLASVSLLSPLGNLSRPDHAERHPALPRVLVDIMCTGGIPSPRDAMLIQRGIQYGSLCGICTPGRRQDEVAAGRANDAAQLCHAFWVEPCALRDRLTVVEDAIHVQEEVARGPTASGHRGALFGFLFASGALYIGILFDMDCNTLYL